MKKIITLVLVLLTTQISYSQNTAISTCNTVACTYVPGPLHPAGTIDSIVVPNIACNGGTTTATVYTNLTVGSTVSYDLWLGTLHHPAYPITGGNSFTISGLFSGTKTVIVEFPAGVFDTLEFFIDQPDPIFNILNSFNITCFGANDGQVILTTALGTPVGTAGYFYSLNGGGFISYTSPHTILGLTPGGHTINIQDANGCLYSGNTAVTIIEPPQLAVSTISMTAPVTCFGLGDGTATVTISGGTANYTYQWVNNSTGLNVGLASTTPSTTNTLTAAAGTYYCDITDANGCPVTSAIVTITQSTAALAVSTISMTAPVSCNGGNNGTATVTISGGTANYTYQWVDNSTGLNVGLASTTPSITNTLTAAAGTYYCDITDANGCPVTSATVTITQPAVLAVTITTDSDVSCNGGFNGQATANASGGTPSGTAPFYSFSWNTTPTPQNTSTATGLSAGSYTVTITDAAIPSCPPIFALVTITEPSPVIVTGVTTDVDCNGNSTGAINLTVTGGIGTYEFNWSNFATTEDVTGLPAGPYNVIVTDNLSCSDIYFYTISEPSLLASSLSVTEVTCNGYNTGAINQTIIGGTLPHDPWWQGTNLSPNPQNSEDLINLLAGTYNCVITDGNGCTLPVSATVIEPTAITLITAPYTVPVTCYGLSNGAVSVDATGGTPGTTGTGYTYNWANTYFIQSPSGLAAGLYSLTVYDVNNCPAVTSVTVSQPTQITTTLSVINVTCYGGNDGVITANSTAGATGGPYIYGWSNPTPNDPINNGLVAGTYDLVITDNNPTGNFCSETFLGIIVTEPPPITNVFTITPITVTGANDGIITAGVTGGSGSYNLSWTGPNGFVGSGVTINGLSAGVYTLVVTDNSGCPVQTFTTALSNPNCGVIITSTYIAPECYGDLGSLIWSNSGGVPPYTNLLVNSNDTLYNNLITAPSVPLLLPAGVYDLLVTDDSDSSCFAILNTPVIVPDSIRLSITTTDVSCFGGSNGTATATISGGTTIIGGTSLYQPIDWGSANPNNLIAGNYYVSVEDANFCASAVVTYTISEPTELLIDSVVTTLVSCAGTDDGTATVFGSGGTPGPLGYAYFWSNGETTQTINHLAVGTYWVIITDDNGCWKDSLNIQITQAPLLIASIQDTAISCNGGADGILTAIVTGGTPGYTYSWWDLGQTPIIIIGAGPFISSLSAGSYSLLVNDINGCASSFAVTTLLNPTPMVVTLYPTDVTLNGANDGIISTSVSGGTSPYTYTWTGPNGFSDLNSTITGLEPGTYTLMVTDNAGCTQVQQEVINEDTCDVTITPIINQPDCADSLGTISWTNAGGGLSYTNTITDVTNSNNFQYTSSLSSDISPFLAEGDYSLHVEDQYGCSDLVNFIIVAPAPLTPDITITHVSCFGGSNGTVSITGIGGTAPYTVNYGTVDTLALYAGVETYILTDFNGCPNLFALPYEITQPDSIILNPTELSPVSCTGNTDGSATVTLTGGTAPYNYQWTPSGDTTSTIISFAGLHWVTVTDTNGCTSAPTSVTITAPTPFIATIIPTDVSCFGGNDGTAIVTTSGGTAPVTYLWDNGYTIPSLVSILIEGAYECIVIDSNGCTDTATTIVNQPTEILANLTLTHVSCNGNANGGATVSPTGGGGNGSYNILWYDGTGNTFVPSTLQPGTGYWVTITDNTSCSTPISPIFFTITQPGILSTVTSVLSSPSCNGLSNGSVIVAVTGGTSGAYDYQWTDVSNTSISTTNDSIAHSLSAGTYYVEVTDTNGCIANDTIIVTEPAPIMANISADSTQCDGNGSATTTPTGGTGPYTYSWSGGTGVSTDSTYSGLNSTTTYNVTITDANLCSLVGVPVNIPSAVTITGSFTLSTYNGFNVSCYGMSDGSATAPVISGGAGPYTYVWSTGALTDNIAGQSAGTYTVTITDTNGCQGTDTITLTEPTEILSGLALTHVSCNGANDGSASINPTGGSGTPYTISWYDGTTTNINAGPISPGSGYWVTITDNTSCSTPISPIFFTITEPGILAPVTSVLSSPSCNGLSNGSVIVAVTGGTSGAYDYQWTDASNTPISTTNDSIAHSLSAGTYYVEVTDTNGCDATVSVSLSSPTAIAANITFTSPSCNGYPDASAITTPTGGTGPYTYQWTGGTTVGTDSTYSGLNSATTYYLTITDANGCISTALPVNVPATAGASISFTLSNYNGFNVSCYDSANAIVTVNVSGGISPYLYSEDNLIYIADSIFNNISAGLYSMFVLEAGGCIVNADIMITAPTAIDPNITTTSLTCNGLNDGALLSEPTGGFVNPTGYGYEWSNLGIIDSIVGLNAGTYSVIVTDANGCTGYDTVILTPDYTLSTTTTTTDVSCYGMSDGGASITVSGGTPIYSHLWSNGAITPIIVGGLSFGAYWCTITDGNGCTITDTVNISQTPNSLIITDTDITNVSCNGGNDGDIKITVTGGAFPYFYSWTDTSSTIISITNNPINLSAGTYYVEITDGGCWVYDTLIVTEPDSIIMTINPIDISCFGENDGTISTLVSGGTPGYTYLWSNGHMDSIVSNLSDGTYSVTVMDANGCTLMATASILSPDPLVCIVVKTDPLCHNDTNGTLDLDITGGTQPYAANYMSVFYPIANNSIIISGLSAGSDTLYITDANGCILSGDTITTLTHPLELEITDIDPVTPTCYNYADGVAQITVIGGTTPYTYLWSDGTITNPATNFVSGTYSCTVTDINGCTDTTSFTLNNPYEIEVIATIEDVLCFGTSEGSISVNVENTIGNYQIFWQGANDSIFIDNLTAGLYYVTIIDDNSCTKTDSILVNQNEEMVINYTVSAALCKDIEDGIIEINNIYGGTPPYNIYKNGELHTEGTYNSATIDNLASSDNNIPYIITVIDDNNCEKDSAIMIDYIGGYNCIDEPIIISPNYDGTNDVWQPVLDLDVDIEVSILNRWGELEFYYTGNSILFIWDGVPTNGKKLPSTDYYYIIKFKNNSYPARTGALTLIR